MHYPFLHHGLRLKIPSRTLASVPLSLALSGLAQPVLSQDTDTSPQRTAVAGSITVTTKGISTVPSFTLGKPAAIFDVSLSRRALSFEPQFKFGLDGKPWAFLFWGRYKLLEGEKFRMQIGAHPALSFRTTSVSIDGLSRDVILVRRYLAAELHPSYALTKNISMGPYYLYSYGIEKDVTRHNHFLAARANLASIRISDRYFVRFVPQLYYLRTDDLDGFYLNSGLTAVRRNFPLSISTLFNKTIESSVGGEDFLWNVSLNYSIN